MLLRIMLRWKSCFETIEANKPEPEEATQDKMYDFNEESLDITLARVMTINLMLTRFRCKEAK